MNFRPAFPGSMATLVSDCGGYEIRGSYSNGYFAWRGRVVATDTLVSSSADRSQVEQLCERHAAAARAEAS
jgi:hypothetical protein